MLVFTTNKVICYQVHYFIIQEGNGKEKKWKQRIKIKPLRTIQGLEFTGIYNKNVHFIGEFKANKEFHMGIVEYFDQHLSAAHSKPWLKWGIIIWLN